MTTTLRRYEASFFASAAIESRKYTALIKIANAFDAFEPLIRFRGVSDALVNDLAELGLVEKGRCDHFWRQRGHEIGVRLSELGWRILRRGKKPLPN